MISAAPEEVIRSALQGIVPEHHIFGTRFRYDDSSGEIQSIERVTAGYGKVVVLEELRRRLGVGYDRVVYVGDGSSDVHVMLNLNRLGTQLKPRSAPPGIARTPGLESPM